MWGTRHNKVELCSTGQPGAAVPTRARRTSEGGGATRSVELERDELRFLLADVRQRVSVAAGQPFHVAGFEVSGHGALAFDVAADFQIADRDQ